MENKKGRSLRAGMHVGSWEIIGKAGCSGKGRPLFLCRCKCGTVREVLAHSLAYGTSRSCGCARRENLERYNLNPHRIADRSRKRVVMAVEDDEFELPIAVADTVLEMSRMLGVSYGTVGRCLNGSSKHFQVKTIGWSKVLYVYI